MRPYDAVLFDLDGTITESEPGIVASVQYSLDVLGYKDYTPELLRAFIGPPLYETYTGVLGMDDETAREGVRLYRERFDKVGWSDNSVYTGIPRLLKSLKDSGVYLAIATAKPRVFAERVLEHFGLIGFFDAVCAIELHEMHADKAELVRRALPERYERACMVGDRKYDMEGAVRNGIDALGVLYGYGSRVELESSGATAVYDSVFALANALLPEGGLRPGVFITLEGPDGSGKSTQAETLANWLRTCGYEVVKTREPGGCEVAERIRELVLGVETIGMTDLCEAYLFAASRSQHVSEVIKPALARGAVVLCERFVDSSAAFQGAGRMLGIEEIYKINAPAVQGCMPDLTVFFDVSPDVALERRRASTGLDRIESEGVEFMLRVYEGYQIILKGNINRVEIVDGRGSVEEVAMRAREAVMRRLTL